MSQKIITTKVAAENVESCPAEALLKLLSGKWKPQIFLYALNGPIRFSELLRNIAGSNKQTIAIALKELVEHDILTKQVISEKPLHIEYRLFEKGQLLIPVFRVLENIS